MQTQKIVIELDGTNGVTAVEADLADTAFLSRIAASIVSLHETILQLQAEHTVTASAQSA